MLGVISIAIPTAGSMTETPSLLQARVLAGLAIGIVEVHCQVLDGSGRSDERHGLLERRDHHVRRDICSDLESKDFSSAPPAISSMMSPMVLSPRLNVSNISPRRRITKSSPTE